jgi:hypothetical protein
MKQKSLLLLSTIIISSTLFAEDITSNATLTNLSLDMDKDGYINPNIFIPIYYGTSNQFYSAIGYTSSNSQEVEKIDGFSDSKSAVVSSKNELTLNYINYSSSFGKYKISIGIESKFTETKYNEFGYIHDSDNNFNNGEDYYISFDNDIDLNINRHAITTDILVPMGEYFSSRFFTSISPYTTIDVTQSTIFKPLVTETGKSSSSTLQKIAYTFRYDALVKTHTFINLGFVAIYDNQPLKYDIAQLQQNNSEYTFKTTTIDTNEKTLSLIGKIIFNFNIMGGLHPSIGYGSKKVTIKDNTRDETTTNKTTFVTIGFEKTF